MTANSTTPYENAMTKVFQEQLIDPVIAYINKQTNPLPYLDVMTRAQDLHYQTHKYVYDGNLSDIESLLIQECGRFTEHYNSDLLITLNSMHKTLTEQTQPITEPILYIFAMRESGVDSNCFFMNRLSSEQSPDNYYRKVYGCYLIPCSMLDNYKYHKDAVIVFLQEVNNIYKLAQIAKEKRLEVN